jgi:UDP-galactopyranose mutase
MDNYNYDYDYDYLIVGCGLSGVVLAERIANILKKKVLIIDKRDHIGGNCYDYIHSTGIRMNKYGAHLFHTNKKEVWDYINQFDEWERWEHAVLSYVDNKYVSIPVNITTINTLCNENLENKEDVERWLSENQVKYSEINNSEEMAKSRIGEELYEKLIKNYTFKQWNKYPHELNKQVLERIPIRPNFDTRYFNDKYQALPKHGYTHFFEKILDNPLINVQLNTDFFEFKKNNSIENKKIIYTGPIDLYFSELGYDPLEYRSIDFTIKTIPNCNYYQPNSVVNYPSNDVSFTRIVEYKHFLNQPSNDTVIVSETSNDRGEPYYPVLNNKNMELYAKYKNLADKEKNILFVGRLANYKYFNMDEAISNALDIFKRSLNL